MKIFLLNLLFCIVIADCYTQNCLPDSQYIPQCPGVYPDSIVGLPPAYACQPYNAVITVIVPYDTVIPPYTLIDSAVLASVTDLPPGFIYSCNPPDCSFPGGTAGCILLTGNPTLADTGTYTPVGNVFGYVSIAPGNPIPFAKIDYYHINILPGQLSANISVASPISCYSACDGVLQAVNECGGNPPITFVWSNGQTTQSISGLCEGNYSVTVSDADTTVTANISFSEPTPFSVTITTASPVGECNGTATANASGGTSPYTFVWNTADSTSTVDSICEGVYLVTVTDANGCEQTSTILLLGTKELDDKNQVEIFPNPNDGNFNVQISGYENVQIVIQNILGEKIFTSTLNHQLSTNLPSGQYFLQIITQQNVFREKIIVIND